ncbi:MAG: dockerin type I domain-containing protein, partial [Candidatus Zixiibacteriota bacterium]
CYDGYSYKIAYGLSDENLDDTLEVPPFSCSYDIAGLSEYTTYFVSVYCIPDNGYPPLYYLCSSEVPLSKPRRPEGFTASPDLFSIHLEWLPNRELDISHYKILRKTDGEEWTAIQDNLIDTHFADANVTAGQEYYYRLLAIDNDMIESDTSLEAMSFSATFASGILLVDETRGGDNWPTELEQYQYYAAAFGDSSFARMTLDSGEALKRSLAGQYMPIFYVDDDNSQNLLEGSLDSLDWYLQYETDFFLAGWRTIFAITGQTSFYPGNFFRDNLGLASIAENVLSDFDGATGVNGWPDLEVRNDTYYHAPLPNIDIFTAVPGAEVICTFNSRSGNPFYGNKPVGVAYDTHHGKRVVLGFPLYYLTESSAQALIARVFEYFGEESVLYGDVNGDWAVNILDITYLINYLYKGGPPPPDPNNGDPNGSCNVNILDVTYLIGYLYKSGPAPLEGCVE